jgi:RNA polymerase sigma-B factor
MRATDRLTARAGRAPTVAQVGAELGLADEEVLEARLAAGLFNWVSFDAPVASTDGETRLGDILGGTDARMDRADQMAELGALGAVLREPERTALGLRFVDDLTQTEIARRMGCSQMQVSRILRRALDRLHVAAERSVP